MYVLLERMLAFSITYIVQTSSQGSSKAQFTSLLVGTDFLVLVHVLLPLSLSIDCHTEVTNGIKSISVS